MLPTAGLPTASTDATNTAVMSKAIFWYMVGLYRYEVGELDEWLDKPLRLRDDETF